MILALLAALMLAFAPQPEPPSKEDILKTPVGKQLSWVLKCINQRAAPDAEGNFTARFLEQYKVEEVQKRLSTLRDEAFKGEEVSLLQHEAEPRPDAISCVIGNEDAERYLSLILSVDEKTGKVAGMLFAITAGPGGEGAAWDSLDGDLGRVQGGLWFGAYEVRLNDAGTRDVEPRIDPVYEFGWRKWLHVSAVSRAWILGACARLIADGKARLTDPFKTDQAKPDQGGMTLRDAIAAAAKAPDAKGVNSAADSLVRFLGRADVESCLLKLTERPETTLPFLTGRESMLLKLPANDAILEEYANGDEEDRRTILSDKGSIARAKSDPADIEAWKKPRQIMKVGWFASNREAGYALAYLHALASRPELAGFEEAWRAPTPKLTVDGVEKDAVVFDPAVWKKTAFLGGSEPGVMTLAWLLERDDGKTFALVMTWNNVDAPLEENKLYELARKGLEVLEKEGRQRPEERTPEKPPEPRE